MSPRDLVAFHTRHKIVLMAHSPRALRSLGQLVAKAGVPGNASVADDYAREFRQTCSLPISTGGHVNALQHLAGYLRGHLSREERGALTEAITCFAAGVVTLDVPRTLLRRFAEQHHIVYLLGQVYLRDGHDD